MNIQKTALFLIITIFVIHACVSHDSSAKIYTITGDSHKLTQKQAIRLHAWRKNIKKIAKKHPENIVINGNTKHKTVALTFDDGPDAHITSSILDILKKHDIRATFFFIGKNIAKYPAIVKRAHGEGHLVLGHTWSHPKLTQLSPEQITQEIRQTEQALTSLIGPVQHYIRPPYGDIDKKTLKILKKLSYKAILWSADSHDWSDQNQAVIIKNITQNTRPGEIILMHSNSNKAHTLAALPNIIQKLKAQGVNFETIDKLRV